MTSIEFKIGSRNSPLALAQARQVRRALCAIQGMEEERIEIVSITTTGDRIFDKSLADFGGKGLFTKEIEEALLEGRIDFAVHSMKDVPTVLPDGLEIASVLEREDPREAFISFRYPDLLSLPVGARLGTSSLRRKAQVLHLRPDLEIVPFRGNVQTRLKKLEKGDVLGTFLAYSGLKRLGLSLKATSLLSIEEMLPAVCQGVIGIEVVSKNKKAKDLALAVDFKKTHIETLTERAFLRELDGSCRTPIAGYAYLEDQYLVFKGQVISCDGKYLFEISGQSHAQGADAFGREMAFLLKEKAGASWKNLICE